MRTSGFLVLLCGLGPNRLEPEYVDPAHHQLVNLVMIPNIDWNDFIFNNDEFKCNSVLWWWDGDPLKRLLVQEVRTLGVDSNNFLSCQLFSPLRC